MTYIIKAENRIRIFARKVRNKQKSWPETPKERERERERTLLRFESGWKIRLREIECVLDLSTSVYVQLWSSILTIRNDTVYKLMC
jgi:hypothetical protein